jgi:predicted permease
MIGLLRDFRYAVRALRQAPGFAFSAVLTLALGIGATAAMFSLLDQVTMRPLPVSEPDRLTLLRWSGQWLGSNTGYAAWSYPWYEDLRDGSSEVFEDFFCRYEMPVSFGHSGETARITAEVVSGNYFDALGLEAIVGRTITPDDDRIPGGHPVAVLSHEFWRDQFASDPGVRGETIQLNGRTFEVIGVSPDGFRGLEFDTPAHVFVPVAMKMELSPGWLAGYNIESRRDRWVNVFGRRKAGISLEQASAAMEPLFRSLVEHDLEQSDLSDRSEYSRERYRQARLEVLPGSMGAHSGRDEALVPMWTLMGMVGLLLLIGCANVASLLMARGAARTREVAVRLAVGASRGRVVQQLMVENLLLAAAGGLAALFVCQWTIVLLVWTIPDPHIAELISTDLDPRVLAFAASVSVLTVLLFGLTPALHSVRVRLVSTLKDQAGAIASGGLRLRKTLVAVQVFLSLVLLIGAGLLVRTLENLREAPPGFNTSETIVFGLDPLRNGYSLEGSRALLRTLRERLGAAPGVEEVGYSLVRLLAGNVWTSSATVEGYEPGTGENMGQHRNWVSPGYFSALGIPILEGRDFRESDAGGAPKVAIVNRKFAEDYFGSGPAVGKHVGFGSGNPDVEIVGVIPDVRYNQMRDELPRQVFGPYDQMDEAVDAHMLVRTSGDPLQLAGTIRQAVGEVDASLPVYDMRPMSVQLESSLILERILAFLAGGFGILATLLSAIGLYGVLAYSMTRRTREIGLRIAMGAQHADIAWLALREVFGLFVVGAALAVPAALVLTRVMQSQLYGVAPHDPQNVLQAIAVLTAVAALAGLLPAWRASRTDPINALRFE